MDDLRLDLAGELGVEHLVGVVAQPRADRYPAQEIGAALPASVEEVCLVDQRRAAAHRLRGSGRCGLEVLARARPAVTREIDVAAAFGAQPLEDCRLVGLAAVGSELGVRIVYRARSSTLAAGDRQLLLCQVLAGEVVREVRRCEDQGAVSKPKHVYESRRRSENLTYGSYRLTGRPATAAVFAILPSGSLLGCRLLTDMTTPPRLRLSHDSGLDWLIALEFGRVDDAQPTECGRGVSEHFGFLHDAPGGRVVGFKVLEFSRFVPEDPSVEQIWAEPRFDAPLVGLSNASAGEIVVAARTYFNGADSLNRVLFNVATQASGEEAVEAWRRCLEAGDAMAHFALGYTLFELGRNPEAYRHLRHYTEIAPHGSWNWCWYGRAAEAVGESAEARRAYQRAIELEHDGEPATDAPELLAQMTSDDPVAIETATPPGDRERRVSPAPPVPVVDRVRGCLIGGAVGDALGAPVEFDSIERIRRRFGPRGVTDYEPAYGRRGTITDDTQMTLFTAEGLIRAYVRGETRGLCHPPGVVDHAYARWLATQGETSGRWDPAAFDGWLIPVRGLHSVRAPGNTCLSALRADRPGTIERPLNDSKGCGAVMRVAPVGLLGRTFPGDRFDLACEIGALTHGHPSGYLAAGALAEILTALVYDSSTLDQALDRAELRLLDRPRHEQTLEALRAARALARSGAEPSPEALATLGEGWVAEEALALGVYCAVVATDFEHGVLLAVNHSGDSDSTGAITGNILGAIHGYGAIPTQWVHDLELHEVIEKLCRDWTSLFVIQPATDVETLCERYPGW